ncbi:hypothetical protein M0802_003862 [Mischocyttarus mexicanus]|nr:hypothetical protein M0802_003862 [Mischocyttarus mexicanus]
MKFRYLGVDITSSKNIIEEVRAQTRKTAMVSSCLRDIIWRNKYMSTNCKSRIYKTCVRPIMSYAIETGAETAATKRLLRSTEMKTLRTISGKTLLDRHRNEDIRKECNVQDIVRWARQKRRDWRDHVARMKNNRLPKIAQTQKPNTSRLPGRQLK